MKDIGELYENWDFLAIRFYYPKCRKCGKRINYNCECGVKEE